MDAEEFVEAINQIRISAIAGLVRALEHPPGRRPNQRIVEASILYNRLSEQDKRAFRTGLEIAAKQSTNNFLSVLDGSLAVENGLKGRLELYYTDGVNRVLLNDPQVGPLNELFGAIASL